MCVINRVIYRVEVERRGEEKNISVLSVTEVCVSVSVCVCQCRMFCRDCDKLQQVCARVLTCVCVRERVHVCICIPRGERVIPDRTESSQPISQHHCDMKLSAHRQQGGGMRGQMGG